MNSDRTILVLGGAGLVGSQVVREIAREHRVPVVENPPVARLLHKRVAIGQEIPAELFKAVAEILAYVYSLRTNRP